VSARFLFDATETIVVGSRAAGFQVARTFAAALYVPELLRYVAA
jgi:hypothetical protein